MSSSDPAGAPLPPDGTEPPAGATPPGGAVAPPHPADRADAPLDAPGATPETAPAVARRRPRVAVLTLAVLLTVVVVGAGVGTYWLVTQLNDARSQIGDQERRIGDQERQIEEQRELIERKDQFGAAMQGFYRQVDPLVGLPYSTLVPWTRAAQLAASAWSDRWDADALGRDAAGVENLTADLAERAAAAGAQAAGNASGTAWESALDRIGGGWVSTSIQDGDTVCGGDAIACVAEAHPFVVEVAGRTRTDPTMTDWIRTGVAYHEYAHVLQYTNPEPTEKAVAAFGGDYETMADCYALTFLDGWSLDHTVDIDASSYWEVSVGYGYTCDGAQRQIIRDWVAGLGITTQTVGG